GKSKQLRQRVLSIRIAALGPEHPIVAHSYVNVATTYFSDGDARAARTYFEDALAIDSKAYGPDSLQSLGAISGLGLALRALGDHAAARASFERALEIATKAYGDRDPRIAELIDHLADLDRDERKYDSALAR